MKISVQTEDFSLEQESAALRGSRTDIGAMVSFTGLVRDMPPGSLTSMTLEHFPGMAEKQLTNIAKEAERRWPLQDLTVIHRYGTLQPGEQIVLVLTASPHRQAAFEAAAFLMDWLKTDAPFWKKEATTDGESWVDAKAEDDAARDRWKS
ncbi:molybdenum cofactor biosynthesis protein MoaE [Emcibacter nanhaiensis]|uniref:Molybdopterin synthase catalytic subunit n=1 Tax=Emcibacter nanhaiensis TaxID=1505037 RepID=A0A501PG12_9PROT|nr:molybdenum cofactor biosynthesis protein MoaE [Emcibacter nanhaiensis]TPD59419.1 molybdenum cofactor biosynthesis protein MoaE [Emcibacter nanhaiensis]